MLGRTIGAYEILSQMGSGPTGEVYRARDTRLGRDVAIKFLPEAIAADPQRIIELEREARTLSTLNHPNIVTMHEMGQVASTFYLVMELVEGKTLKEHLTAGILPAKKALHLAEQTADGLAKAHAAGILHRDLKPENLMVSKDGLVKILNFGLARLAEPEPGAEEGELDTVPMGELGTVSYKSPEQAGGREVDIHSDQFSLGAIMYEMATGTRPFEAPTAAETLAAIIRKEPRPVGELNPGVPAPWRWVIERCLAKDPGERYESTRDLARDLRSIREHLSGDVPVTPLPRTSKRGRQRERVAWIIAAAGLLVSLVLLAISYFSPARVPSEPHVSFSVFPPEEEIFDVREAISPDGGLLAFAASAPGGSTRLWVQALEEPAARLLPGTEGVQSIFWSPDSRYIGFFAKGKLLKIDVLGGPPQVLCDAPEERGGTWNSQGIILLTPRLLDGIYRVPASGGVPEAVTTTDKSRRENHWWPYFLPDGRHFLYLVRGDPEEEQAIYLGSLDGRQAKRLVSADSMGAYAEPGYLLYTRAQTLMAQPFDARTLDVIGEPVAIADSLASRPGFGNAAFSVSENLRLVYCSRTSRSDTQLVWFDRGGNRQGVLGEPGELRSPELSHDEKRVAVERLDPLTRTYDIWVMDLPQGAASRFTFDPANDTNAAWSPDDSRIAFTSNRKGTWDIYQKIVGGPGGDELLFESSDGKNVNQWSDDNRLLVYTSSGPTHDDLWILPLTGARTPEPFVRTRFKEVQGRLSPNGRWMAYVSDETGAPEVYVQPFPRSGAKWQVSLGGGAQPAWRRDGKELFYIAADRKLMARTVHEDGPTFRLGQARALFQTAVSGLINARNHFTVTRDGKRFLINTLLEEPAMPQITVVLNWTELLRRNRGQ